MPDIYNSKTKRIATNTILLYIRMLILMVINLFTVRIVLMSLGVEDYGVYSVVAGVVTMLNSVSNVMANTTQRFYSVYIGKKESTNLNRVFSVSMDVYVLLITIVLLIGESVGLWFVNNHLIIPPTRLVAANWVYQITIVTFITTVVSLPYLAAILAHEKMTAFSVFTTLDCIIKFGLAVLLVYFPGDILINYAIILFVAQFLLMASYILYGRLKFEECKYNPFNRSGLHKEIVSFSSWTFLGSMSGVCMNQVMTILYNIFFGPIVTACRAISLQLNSALSGFCGSFIMALQPPMIKSYSESNHDYVIKLFQLSNKFIFYSLMMVCLPIILEMDTILYYWLNVTDELTINYSRFIVVYFIVLALNNPITIIIQAIGEVKSYFLRVEFFTLLCPIITYILFKLGCNSYFGYFAMITTVTLSHFVRLYCLKKKYSFFNYSDYFCYFVKPAFFITILVLLLLMPIHSFVSSQLLRLFIVSGSSVLVSFMCVYFWGMTRVEKTYLKEVVVKKMKRK